MVKYRDINTGAIKKARFFSTDYTLNQTRLKDTNGRIFVVAAWQLVK